MNQYENSLKAIKLLLDEVGESYWSDWINTDIQQWQRNQDTSHHLSAYGGMGSFNDIYISQTNNNKITDAQEPWANTLFSWLKSTCFFLAKAPSEFFSAEQLSRAIAQYDPELSAFVGGENAPDSMRGLLSDVRKLQGWRCLQCGYAETSKKDIEYVISQLMLPRELIQACEKLNLVQYVHKTLSLDIEGLDTMRQKIGEAVREAGIDISDRKEWMRPCPQCSTDDTAVYRWTLNSNDIFTLVPSDDNLQLKIKRHNKSL